MKIESVITRLGLPPRHEVKSCVSTNNISCRNHRVCTLNSSDFLGNNKVQRFQKPKNDFIIKPRLVVKNYPYLRVETQTYLSLAKSNDGLG